jgi:ribosome biogenesis GTPase
VGRNAAWIAYEGAPGLVVASFPKRNERLALVPGDLVVAKELDAERAVVEERLPREFTLTRTTAGGRTKTMAANVDAIAIVAALAQPELHLGMVDELLAFAELHALHGVVVFTKVDLAPEFDAHALAELYRKLGYATFLAHPKRGDGVDAIATELATRHTLLVGQSGVGKSSLFRSLGGEARVGDVSKIGRGKQTTTTGRLHQFRDGFLIDSPGVGEFELHGCAPAGVADGFVEFGRQGPCRFTDCVHRAEPDCAVRAAAAAGVIAPSRYAGYLAILDRLEHA